MSVNFPSNSGAIQKKIRVITSKINDVSKKLDPKEISDQLNKKLSYKIPKYNSDIKSSIEPKKFEQVSEYIKSSYSGGIQTANEISGLEGTLECEVAMRKVQDKLDETTKMFESLAGKLDNLLEPIQEPLDSIVEILDSIERLVNLSFSGDIEELVSELIEAVESIIKLLVWLITSIIKPFIYTADTMYKGYRELKVNAGVELSKLDSMLNIKCIVNCKYRTKQSQCPVLKKLHLTSCPLLEVIPKIGGLAGSIESGIDGVTAPLDEVFDKVSMITEIPLINQVINRTYPKVTISTVKSALKKISSESYMNQDGITTQPDISSETKTPDIPIA